MFWMDWFSPVPPAQLQTLALALALVLVLVLVLVLMLVLVLVLVLVQAMVMMAMMITLEPFGKQSACQRCLHCNHSYLRLLVKVAFQRKDATSEQH